jgi:hypothetical protein
MDAIQTFALRASTPGTSDWFLVHTVPQPGVQVSWRMTWNDQVRSIDYAPSPGGMGRAVLFCHYVKFSVLRRGLMRVFQMIL